MPAIVGRSSVRSVLSLRSSQGARSLMIHSGSYSRFAGDVPPHAQFWTTSVRSKVWATVPLVSVTTKV
jgi:hypothetical protein